VNNDVDVDTGIPKESEADAADAADVTAESMRDRVESPMADDYVPSGIRVTSSRKNRFLIDNIGVRLLK
jgi:hypothetical protein